MNQFERINDQDEAQQDSMERAARDIRVAMPGIVQAADLEAQTVTVQPAIQGKRTDESGSSYENLPLLVDVPIVWPRAGGFALTFPVREGDECLVVFGDRCIDSWWQSGGVQRPIDDRAHDLSDAFAIITPTSQAKALQNVNADAVELRNDDRTDWICMDHAGKIQINHRSDMEIITHGNCSATIQGNFTGQIGGTADLTVGGATSLKCPSLKIDCPTTQITGNVTIDGTLTANGGTMKASGGTLSMQGTMSAASDVTGGGISLKSHVHSGVESGPSTTGGPQ